MYAFIKFLDFLKTYKDAIAIIALIPAAVWTLLIYRKSKKKESAEWLRKLFNSFYLTPDFYPLRTIIEFDAETTLRPVIERMLIKPDANFAENERRVLCDTDTLLNYFEFILYLESQGQIKESDCEQLFQYWFDLLKKPELGYLRCYCHRFGYEGICQKITGQKRCSELPEYVAFYGTLMKDHGTQSELKIKDRLMFAGPCVISGKLCDLGEYSGLIAGGDPVNAELYKIEDPKVFDVVDKYEEFDRDNPKSSLFVRHVCHVVRLDEPPLDAWVYFYNRPVLNAD